MPLPGSLLLLLLRPVASYTHGTTVSRAMSHTNALLEFLRTHRVNYPHCCRCRMRIGMDRCLQTSVNDARLREICVHCVVDRWLRLGYRPTTHGIIVIEHHGRIVPTSATAYTPAAANHLLRYLPPSTKISRLAELVFAVLSGKSFPDNPNTHSLAAILKTQHHGHMQGTSEEWLATSLSSATPAYIIVQMEP